MEELAWFMLLLHGLPLVAVFRNIACTCRFAAAMAVNKRRSKLTIAT